MGDGSGEVMKMKTMFRAAALSLAVAIAPAAQAYIIVLQGVLSADQVVTAAGSVSTASGLAVVTIDTELFTVTTDLTWTGLSGPTDRAHLHDAPEGESLSTPPNDRFFHEILWDAYESPAAFDCPWSSDPQFPFTCLPATGSAHDVLQLSEDNGYGIDPFSAMVEAFVSGGLYLDMHTELYEAGEIRGQLRVVPEPGDLILVCLALLGSITVTRRIQARRRATPCS
jgi:hypothetical protein